MGCSIPGCGATTHNRRTHDKHVPPQGEALLDQPAEVAELSGADRARAALKDGPPQVVSYEGPAGGPATEANHPRASMDLLGALQASVDRARAGRLTASNEGGNQDTPPTSHGPAAGQSVEEQDPDNPGNIIQPDFNPAVLEAVGRIGDEMDEPHRPGCTLLDPCDNCRAEVAGRSPVRAATSGAQDPITADDIRAIPGVTDTAPLSTDGYDRLPFPPWRTLLGPDEPIRISLPGVYELTADEYHDSSITGDWVSNSDLRAMSAPHCPAKWKYNRDHGVRVTSPAFSFGHAWHARVLGKGETIAVRPAQWSDWRKQEARDWRAEQEAAGRSVILPEDWDAVEAMAAAIYDREEATRLLTQPGRPELAMFWVDSATGVKRRALVDFMPDRANANGVLEIVDIKSTDSASPDDDMERKIFKYGYFRQGVTIMDGALALGLAEDATVFFIFQEKTAPYLVQEVELDAQAQLAGAVENHRALMVYKECLETGVWPSYAPGPVTLSLPPYILARYEDDIEVH